MGCPDGDCGGDLYTVLTRDELLDNIMLYWLPATGASSARLYWESFRQPNNAPVAAVFPVLEVALSGGNAKRSRRFRLGEITAALLFFDQQSNMGQQRPIRCRSTDSFVKVFGSKRVARAPGDVRVLEQFCC
jgi:hypothetical protein